MSKPAVDQLKKIFEICDQYDRNLPLQYVRCLLYIYEQEGMTPAELAERAGFALSTISRITHALADHRQRGPGYKLIEMHPHPDDKRKKKLILSAKGKALVTSLLHLHQVAC